MNKTLLVILALFGAFFLYDSFGLSYIAAPAPSSAAEACIARLEAAEDVVELEDIYYLECPKFGEMDEGNRFAVEKVYKQRLKVLKAKEKEWIARMKAEYPTFN